MVAIMLATVLATPSAAPAQKTDSLRIGTFNTFLVSPPFKKKAFFDPDDIPDLIEDAEKVGEAICRSSFDYDVIALNEVWTETIGKPALVKELTAECPRPFPYVVPYITQILDYHLEDSGLMIFSRFPMGAPSEPLPASWHPVLRINNTIGPFGGAFMPFGGACSGIDCMADKGVAMMRVRNPGNDQRLNVAFTHMQNDTDAGTRATQLGFVKHLFKPLKSGDWGRDMAFVLGDLNVPGRTVEWDNFFNPLATGHGGFFRRTAFSAADLSRNGVSDQWDQTQPRPDAGDPLLTAPADAGSTGPERTDRLDYVLRSQPRSAMCTQHSRLAFPGLSDHLGVNADINRRIANCSPFTAFHMDAPLPGAFRQRTGDLSRRGSVQWIRVNPRDAADREGGAYSIGFSHKGGGYDGKGNCKKKSMCVRFEVYDPKNMTDPLKPFFNETTTTAGKRGIKMSKYVMPGLPVLIKVFHPRRSRAGGEYRLRVYRNECSSKEDSCPLRPAKLFNPKVPADKPVESWFQINTERADSGKPQHLKFYVNGLDSSPKGTITAELRDETGAPISGIAPVSGPAYAGGAPLSLEVPAHAGNQKLFLVVKRGTDDGVTFPTFTVRYTTNLKVLFRTSKWELRFKCMDETGGDALGDDEMTFDLVADGTVTKHAEEPDFDTDQYLPVPGWDRVKFVDSLTIKAQEHGDADDPVTRSITLSDDEIEQVGPASPVVDFPITVPAGNYRFYYNIGHTADVNTSTSASSTLRSATREIATDKDPPPPPTGAGGAGLQDGPSRLAFLTYGAAPEGMNRPTTDFGFAGSNADIGAVGTDLQSEITLAADPALDASPALSPNGRELAFASSRGTGRSAIWIAGADGSGPRAITSGQTDDSEPSWSSDGLRIVFTRRTGVGPPHIWTVGVDGSGLRRLTRGSASATNPAFAPDGESVVFTRLAPRPRFGSRKRFDAAIRRIGQPETDLVSLNLTTGRLTRLTNDSGLESDPVYSPRGDRIAFTKGRPDSDSDIWVMNADGGDARQLTTSEGPERQPAWSPGGEFLAFAAMRTGASAIWTMRADGTEQTQITDGFIHRLAPSWAPAP